MAHDSLILSLYKIGAIKFGNFTLKSGQASQLYLDLRQIISYPNILISVAEAIGKKVHACHFDLICGVPYTALPIATCISIKNNVPMIMRRKEKKSYGTKKQIEGAFKAGQTCLIIEDIITTGSSILETADDLEAEKINITDAVVLIDREQGGKENLQKRNFTLHSVFTLKEIFGELLNSGILTDLERDIIHRMMPNHA